MTGFSSSSLPVDVPPSSSAAPSKEISNLAASVAELTTAFAGQQKLLLDLMTQVANSSLCKGVADTAPAIPILRHKLASVGLSRFKGDNPESWVFQAERYFDFYHIAEDHKLTLASFYLDGEALEWYVGRFTINSSVIGIVLPSRPRAIFENVLYCHQRNASLSSSIHRQLLSFRPSG